MAVIDLTRVNDKTPQIRPLVKIEHAKTSSADTVLTEVMFGDLRCCYLANNTINPNNGDLYSADIATMMLPAEFMHLTYKISSKEVKIPSSGNVFNPNSSAYIVRDESIFTPLLLLLQSNTPNVVINNAPQFHICSNLNYRNDLNTLGVHGCATFTDSLTNNSKEHLFYFKGKALLASVISQGTTSTPPSSFDISFSNVEIFLLPILISEKMVAYYAIKKEENWELKIKAWYSSSGTNISIVSPMMYNDDLGVFITTDARKVPLIN